MVEIIAIILLGVIIIAQLIERFIYAREMNKQMRVNLGALFSRNVNDYLASTKETVRADDTPSEPEDIELSDMDDKEFEAHIANINNGRL